MDFVLAMEGEAWKERTAEWGGRLIELEMKYVESGLSREETEEMNKLKERWNAEFSGFLKRIRKPSVR